MSVGKLAFSNAVEFGKVRQPKNPNTARYSGYRKHAVWREFHVGHVEVLIERDVKHLVERHGFDEKAARQWADALAQGTGGNATVSPVRAALGKAITRTEGMIYNIPDAARNLLNQMEYIEQEAGPLA